MSGFGNVLFQILAYRKIKSEMNSVKYINVLTEKNFITKMNNSMIHERLYDDFIDEKDIAKITLFKAMVILFFGLISKKLKKSNSISTFYSDSNQLEKPYSANIFGYFQYKDFLEENKNLLLELGREIFKRYKKNKSHIIVHYRMGDSGWAREYASYYDEVKKLIMNETETVYIATDSPKSALEFFSDCNNIQLTNAKSALDDFKYMVSAKKLYCAPSTFSWWAAHSLSTNSSVIMPSFFKKTIGIYMPEENLIVLD